MTPIQGTRTVRVKLDEFNLLGPGARRGIILGITEAAFAIEQRAKYGVVEQDAVDTGALMNSIYTQSALSDGRDAAVAAAAMASTTKGKHSGKPHDEPFTDHLAEEEHKGEGLTAKVGVAAEYGIYIEDGTPSGSVTPRPFLGPAAESVRGKLASIVGKQLRIALKWGG